MNLWMTHSSLGLLALGLFVLAYILVMTEEMHHLRKSKPVVLTAGIIWALVAIAAKIKGLEAQITPEINHSLLEYSNLFLFLLVAMTYVNALEERKVFEALKGWMLKKGYSYRTLFWMTGFIAFFISPVADNMTTALIICAVVLAIDSNNARFVSLSCVNIVIAANAGGAFSPFGDITTLMVWQQGAVPFADFFYLFIPSLVNYIVPAFCMMWMVPHGQPAPVKHRTHVELGGYGIIVLFLLTILTSVLFNHYFHLPACIGMMTGFAYLQIFAYFITRKENKKLITHHQSEVNKKHTARQQPGDLPFDIFYHIRRIEWDTLLFFYGVMLCIAGLSAFGYLQLSSDVLYHGWGSTISEMHQQTLAHISLGLLSAVIDNIPLMYAVLTMDPTMSLGQWLLITLTTGVGGSVLSIGSAAGVALMGQARQHYTFISHLKWSWAILLGYFAAIATHFALNYSLFSQFAPSP